jgi:Putative prokaryotic signal transducing protein
MEKPGPKLVEVLVVQGQIAAEVVKSHLESEGIPVLLKYESAGPIFGITVDGLGKVKILVPKDLAEEAERIIKPQGFDKSSE